MTQGLLSPSSWEMRGHHPPGPGISCRHGKLPAEPSRSPRLRKEGTKLISTRTWKHRLCGPQPVTRVPPRLRLHLGGGGRDARLTQLRPFKESVHTHWSVTQVLGHFKHQENGLGVENMEQPCAARKPQPAPTNQKGPRLLT